MASKRQSLILAVVLMSVWTMSFANLPPIAVNWGQNGGEGSLAATCESGNYEYVLLSFLNTFGCVGRNPTYTPNLDGHCGNGGNPCTSLQSEIATCQGKGVKVILSLGGSDGTYSLCSTIDVDIVANNLYAKFLSGGSGPLGSVTLDGINLDIRKGSNLYWENLVDSLNSYRNGSKGSGTFSLSASPQCFLPDSYLDNAIQTGNLDYVIVQFYNDPSCQYSGQAGALVTAWNSWAFSVPQNSKLFLGIPASPNAANVNGGYIPPSNLNSDVLLKIKGTNFGGVALWDRYADLKNQYSEQIKPYLQHPTTHDEYVISQVTDATY